MKTYTKGKVNLLGFIVNNKGKIVTNNTKRMSDMWSSGKVKVMVSRHRNGLYVKTTKDTYILNESTKGDLYIGKCDKYNVCVALAPNNARLWWWESLTALDKIRLIRDIKTIKSNIKDIDILVQYNPSIIKKRLDINKIINCISNFNKIPHFRRAYYSKRHGVKILIHGTVVNLNYILASQNNNNYADDLINEMLFDLKSYNNRVSELYPNKCCDDNEDPKDAPIEGVLKHIHK